jgi:hypothetical protein
LKGTIVRTFVMGQARTPPSARGGSNGNGTEDSALDHAEGVRQCIRRPQRDADTIVQSALGHSVRGSRNMKGVQPFACI